jgi:HlyD family secretion protein
MPAEIFLQTSERTLPSYLMKPLADRIHGAFREK